MARPQVGAAPSAATDTATKGYVDTTAQPLDADLTAIAQLTAPATTITRNQRAIRVFMRSAFR